MITTETFYKFVPEKYRQDLLSLCKIYFTYYTYNPYRYDWKFKYLKSMRSAITAFAEQFDLVVEFLPNYPDKILFMSKHRSSECFEVDGFTGKVISNCL